MKLIDGSSDKEDEINIRKKLAASDSAVSRRRVDYRPAAPIDQEQNRISHSDRSLEPELLKIRDLKITNKEILPGFPNFGFDIFLDGFSMG